MSDQNRAKALKAGPNSIVEDVIGPRSKARAPEPRPQVQKAERDPGRVLEACPLAHYLALDFGGKFDQCAGFQSHARGWGPRTIPEWRQAFADFMAKPVK